MDLNILFLLPPGFQADGIQQYCPECAEVWGLLSYYPAIKEALEIRYQPIDRPRPEMVNALSTEHQNCPTLWLKPRAPEFGAFEKLSDGGERFIDNARDIGCYFSECYGTPVPR